MSQYIDTASRSVGDRSESFVKCPKCVVAAVTFAVALGAAAFILVGGQSSTVDETGATQVQGALSGYEYGTDATAGRVAGPGVTSEFHGQSGELWPAAVVSEYLGGSRVLSPETIAKIRANDMVEFFGSQAQPPMREFE